MLFLRRHVARRGIYPGIENMFSSCTIKLTHNTHKAKVMVEMDVYFLMGTKTVLNELIAYVDMRHLLAGVLCPKSMLIMSYALKNSRSNPSFPSYFSLCCFMYP